MDDTNLPSNWNELTIVVRLVTNNALWKKIICFDGIIVLSICFLVAGEETETRDQLLGSSYRRVLSLSHSIRMIKQQINVSPEIFSLPQNYFYFYRYFRYSDMYNLSNSLSWLIRKHIRCPLTWLASIFYI